MKCRSYEISPINFSKMYRIDVVTYNVLSSKYGNKNTFPKCPDEYIISDHRITSYFYRKYVMNLEVSWKYCSPKITILL